ncbi:hypothetical protein C5167_029616 [Papaver somniferum]|nr:hypothetical protein C5167_029616 [Papaver somniferum]
MYKPRKSLQLLMRCFSSAETKSTCDARKTFTEGHLGEDQRSDDEMLLFANISEYEGGGEETDDEMPPLVKDSDEKMPPFIEDSIGKNEGDNRE